MGYLGIEVGKGVSRLALLSVVSYSVDDGQGRNGKYIVPGAAQGDGV